MATQLIDAAAPRLRIKIARKAPHAPPLPTTAAEPAVRTHMTNENLR
jgi:hypothetical protein